jgi:hypothetical protein
MMLVSYLQLGKSIRAKHGEPSWLVVKSCLKAGKTDWQWAHHEHHFFELGVYSSNPTRNFPQQGSARVPGFEPSAGWGSTYQLTTPMEYLSQK